MLPIAFPSVVIVTYKSLHLDTTAIWEGRMILVSAPIQDREATTGRMQMTLCLWSQSQGQTQEVSACTCGHFHQSRCCPVIRWFK